MCRQEVCLKPCHLVRVFHATASDSECQGLNPAHNYHALFRIITLSSPEDASIAATPVPESETDKAAMATTQSDSGQLVKPDGDCDTDFKDVKTVRKLFQVPFETREEIRSLPEKSVARRLSFPGARHHQSTPRREWRTSVSDILEVAPSPVKMDDNPGPQMRHQLIGEDELSAVYINFRSSTFPRHILWAAQSAQSSLRPEIDVGANINVNDAQNHDLQSLPSSFERGLNEVSDHERPLSFNIRTAADYRPYFQESFNNIERLTKGGDDITSFDARGLAMIDMADTPAIYQDPDFVDFCSTATFLGGPGGPLPDLSNPAEVVQYAREKGGGRAGTLTARP